MADAHINRIRELLESFSTAMLVTHGTDSPHHARPMAIARVEPNCDVWFFTGRSSAKVDEIRNDQHVLIVCQDETGKYLAVRGVARLIVDRAKTSELWSDSLRKWFPKGMTDPDVMLIRVKAQEAEYWESPGHTGARHLFETAKAYVRGAMPTEGEHHGKISFAE
jgi:general stress protein 26